MLKPGKIYQPVTELNLECHISSISEQNVIHCPHDAQLKKGRIVNQ